MSRQRRNTRKLQEYQNLEEFAVPPRRISNKGNRRQQPGGNVFNFKQFVEQKKTVSLIPQSESQSEYVDHLLNPEKMVVFATGPAGTGKTWLAVLAAIKALKSGEINKIVITRPAVGTADEKHGFLPGTLDEKMAPWVKPIFDVFKEYYSSKELAIMLEEEIIELAPIAFLRGRTFKNSFIIADEMQNSNITAMKALLTRIGENSKIVVTGDLDQMDKPFTTDNGLRDFDQRLKKSNSSSICAVHFTNKDICRHPVITEILAMYDEN